MIKGLDQIDKKKLPGTIRWMARFLKGFQYILVLLCLLSAIGSAMSVYNILLMRELVDVATGGTRDAFLQVVGKVAVVTAVQICLGFLSQFLWTWTGSTMSRRVKEHVFEQLMRRDYEGISAVHSGEWMSRLSRDVQIVAGSVIELLPGIISAVINAVGVIYAVAVVSPTVAAVILPAGALLMLASTILREPMKKMHKRMREADGAARVVAQDQLTSLLVVHCFGMADRAVAILHEKLMLLHKERLRRMGFSMMFSGGYGVAMNIAYLAGTVWCGFALMAGTITYGTIVALMQLVSRVQGVAKTFAGFLPSYYGVVASAERLMEAEQYGMDDYVALPREKVAELAASFRELSCRDVTFGYRDAEPVLNNVDLTIRRHETIVLTGPSGCGKSTLLRVLMGVYTPRSGQVTALTEAGEAPVAKELKNLFAYVPQGNQLISGTIRQAITFGDEEAMKDEPRLHRALSLACAEEFVAALPEGLDTKLGERGQGLSEGQLQRVAIARALFSDRPVLLLDEATAALDEDTAFRVLENLRTETEKTIILVTHRQTDLPFAARRIRIEDGTVTE